MRLTLAEFNPGSLRFGPDGKLYVCSLDGPELAIITIITLGCDDVQNTELSPQKFETVTIGADSDHPFTDMGFDFDGNLWLISRSNLLKFNPQTQKVVNLGGEELIRWGENPQLFLTNRDTVLISTDHNLVEVDINGALLREVGVSFEIEGMALNSRGDIIATSGSGPAGFGFSHGIHILHDDVTQYNEHFDEAFVTHTRLAYYAVDEEFEARGLAVDSSDNIIVLGRTGVYVFAPNGRFLQKIDVEEDEEFDYHMEKLCVAPADFTEQCYAGTRLCVSRSDGAGGEILFL